MALASLVYSVGSTSICSKFKPSSLHLSKASLAVRCKSHAAASSSEVFGARFQAVGGSKTRGIVAKRSLRTMATAAAPTAPKSLYDFTVEDINGEQVSLSKYKGKVALIVNVASACGLTNGNYTELTSLYEKYKDKGLEILAFPCNQFGGQEPGTNEQIKNFACSRYKATFPLFAKVDVNGANAAPLYKWLKAEKPAGLFGVGDGIKWNFGKFLVDKEGKVVERYAPTTSPSSIAKDIEKLL